MKKTAVLLCLILTFTVAGSAMAEKARGIASEAASAYHFAHLQQHLFATDLHGTGNYLKVREQPMPSNVLGHLEQADSCILLSLKNGYAKVIVTQSAKTSPHSWVGLTGWVDADYLDCNCNDAQYSGAAPLPAAGAAEPDVIPTEAAGTYLFCSRAGGWLTELTLLPNGAFFGNYHDSEMGDVTAAHPNGIVYACDFSGRFGSLQPINDYSGTLALTVLTPSPFQDFIRDGIQYIASEPFGVENSPSFLLYTPDTPVSALSEECLSWLYGSMAAMPEDRLGCYVLFNPVDEFAFSQQPE